MYVGYNTNGFAHHRIDDAISILADLGYEGIGLTLDHGVLNPLDANRLKEAERIRGLLEKRRLKVVIETGARFLLDPRHKHQPTLLSPTPELRQRRLRFLETCVELARVIGAEAVSFWSGSAIDDASEETLWQRLTQGCRSLMAEAAVYGVPLAFEPEPGMFIDTLSRFGEFEQRLGETPLGLALDLGHLHCQGEIPIADRIREWGDRIRVVHIEDMREGIHDHLRFGEGDMRFPPILAALRDMNYQGGIFVELSRHGHDAVRTAEHSFEFLKQMMSKGALGVGKR